MPPVTLVPRAVSRLFPRSPTSRVEASYGPLEAKLEMNKMMPAPGLRPGQLNSCCAELFIPVGLHAMSEPCFWSRTLGCGCMTMTIFTMCSFRGEETKNH